MNLHNADAKKNTGHCKKLAPEYEILGSQYSAEADGVVIAKVCTSSQQYIYADVSCSEMSKMQSSRKLSNLNPC